MLRELEFAGAATERCLLIKVVVLQGECRVKICSHNHSKLSLMEVIFNKVAGATLL